MKNSTKRALLMSVVSMFLCFTMLIGTTFAWFTDSVTSGSNKVVAGNLDVKLYQWTAADASTEITNASAPLFGAADSTVAQNDATDTIWEPGKTQVVYLSIKNAGNLALKYKVAIDVRNPANGNDLYEVMQYAITPDATFGDVTAWDANNGYNVVVGNNKAMYDGAEVADVKLQPGEEHFFALSVHMMEGAGNEYMKGKVEFDITVLAGQLDAELDSFGSSSYDKYSSYPGKGYAPAPTGNVTAAEILISGTDGYKDGSVIVPKEAVATGATELTAEVVPSDYEGNFTIDTGIEKVVYDVTVTGIKDDNKTPIKTQLKIAAGLDPATVKVYHVDTLIASTYNPNTGYVTFETTGFSPFTILYDAESVYQPPVVDENTALPQANVEEYALANTPGYATGEDAPKWGSYGQWSPAAGLDSKLEAAYVFTCAETLEQAKLNPYANWYCDFYVKLDKDLGENQIFLGGNYGSFGWVGFHNGELTLEANTEIPLLGSVTSNPWTYLNVVQNVGTFICGVGDVNNALAGATFTVMLRLTNPADATDFVNVATITYTFTGAAQ